MFYASPYFVFQVKQKLRLKARPDNSVDPDLAFKKQKKSEDDDDTEELPDKVNEENSTNETIYNKFACN